MSRKDCCLNFFRNGFRKRPSCMPSSSDPSGSTGFETRKNLPHHNRDASNLEMFMNAADSDLKKNHEVKDEYEL